MFKLILVILLIIIAVPIIAYIIGKYASVDYFSAKEYMKNQKKDDKQ
jgi:multisubunit Na+/H+ antiporter MnhG subunit